jgi:hypothetical protein
VVLELVEVSDELVVVPVVEVVVVEEVDCVGAVCWAQVGSCAVTAATAAIIRLAFNRFI